MPVKHRRPPTLFILAGLVLLAGAIVISKEGSAGPARAASLEAQLDQALAAGRPTVVFLHSYDCVPCKQMIDVVDQVYPEFAASVVLVDVDVYDPTNLSLMRRERLQAIPTLVFYNRLGGRQVHVGVMPAEQLHGTLRSLAGDK
jgi:thioredoxin 1